ncbi:MAG: potassium channel family protein [Gallionella sp.]
MASYQESKVIRNLLIALLALVMVFIIGTLGYHMLGGDQYSWMECFYMTFITISTIGYGEVVDVTHYEYGQLFTVFVGMSGIGVLGYVLSAFTAFMLESELDVALRGKKMQKKISQLKDHYIVCGVGRVGSNVAQELAVTGRQFIMIDGDINVIHRYLDSHPAQLYLHGDATSNDLLLEAGVTQACGVFAVAHDDSANLVISLSAKLLNPEVRVVARCHDMKNAEKTRRVGADEIVSPDYSGGLSLVSAMVRPNVMSFFDEIQKSDSNLRMEEIRIPKTPGLHRLNVLYQENKDCMVLAIQRQGVWQLNPSSAHTLLTDDVLMVMTTPQGRSRLEDIILGWT